MTLKKIENASVIHIQQFKEWRKSGIAFEFGDQKYSTPNRTMSSYTEVFSFTSSIRLGLLWFNLFICIRQPSAVMGQYFAVVFGLI